MHAVAGRFSQLLQKELRNLESVRLWSRHLVRTFFSQDMEDVMPKKFDPAPADKHAANPKQARKADKEMQDDLDTGLDGSFPASDPVSATAPANSKSDPPKQ